MKSLTVLLLFTVIVYRPAAVAMELHEIREIHYQMGTLLDLTLWHTNPDEGKRIGRRAFQEVHRLDTILSHYDPDSSLSGFNKKAGQGKVFVDPELFQLLSIALDFSKKTSGYFDVTVGPLVELWEQAAKEGRPPGSTEIASVLKLVGHDKLRLHSDGTAELRYKGMKVDLGGIGKGYAVDRVMTILRRAGVHASLIHFGGSSIYALGSPPGEHAWKIGVQGLNGTVIGIVQLTDTALSTSGTMGRYWEVGVRRFGHIINSKTGMPASEPRSATVIASTATLAEALTKPLLLAGEKELQSVKDFPKAEALLVLESGELSFSDAFLAKTNWYALTHP